MAKQLGPFEVGQIKAHVEHGLGCTTISGKIFKADGKTVFSETAVHNAMCKLQDNPAWRGERESGSGAPRKTTKKQDRAVITWVLKQRGKQKISVSRVKKHFPYLRKFNDSLVEERLHENRLARCWRSCVCRECSAELGMAADMLCAFCQCLGKSVCICIPASSIYSLVSIWVCVCE